jgi:hypothetical protein
MKRKYSPKYPRTWNEYDSDDLNTIVKNIKKHQNREWWKLNLPIAVAIAIIIIFVLSKGLL